MQEISAASVLKIRSESERVMEIKVVIIKWRTITSTRGEYEDWKREGDAWAHEVGLSIIKIEHVLQGVFLGIFAHPSCYSAQGSNKIKYKSDPETIWSSHVYRQPVNADDCLRIEQTEKITREYKQVSQSEKNDAFAQ